MDLAPVIKSADILGRFGEGVDAGFIKVEDLPFALEPGNEAFQIFRAQKILDCRANRQTGRIAKFVFEGEIDDDLFDAIFNFRKVLQGILKIVGVDFVRDDAA